MMQEKNRQVIDNLLVRILEGSAERDDIIFFSTWIKDYSNEIYFEKFKEMWHVSVDTNYIDNNVAEHDPEKFISYIKRSKLRDRNRKRAFMSISAAAVIVLMIGLTQFLNKGGEDSIHTIDFKELSYSKDSVKVELNNGETVKSMKSRTANITTLAANIEQSGQTTEAPQAKVYNTVSTPPGERVAMVLSDGTVVYLTSNSYLKYPSKFDSHSREVTLVGRAYFEVKKSKVPFIVKTSDMNVEVLGTSFDVESRTSGTSTSVILVEGSVKVEADGRTKIIYPNEQISLHRETKEITVKNVDSKLMTMWKDGVLIVHGQSFEELVESLSSWYGVQITDLTTVSKFERFNGRFDREDIEAAIKAVAISANIRYRIDAGKLILENR
ncbi:FecR domain-containing protein [Bacteroidota bacterium]